MPPIHKSIPSMPTALGLMHSSCLDVSLLANQATQYLLPIKARYSHMDRSLCFLSFTAGPADTKQRQRRRSATELVQILVVHILGDRDEAGLTSGL